MFENPVVGKIKFNLPKLHDKKAIKTLLDEISKMQEVLSKRNYFFYQDNWYTVKELRPFYNKHTGQQISSPSLLYKIRTRGVQGAFDLEWASFDCPDGIMRTHEEIADYFGLSKSTWYHRYIRIGFDRSWEQGSELMLSGRPKKNNRRMNESNSNKNNRY